MTKRAEILSTKSFSADQKQLFRDTDLNLTEIDFLKIELLQIPETTFTPVIKNAIVTSQNAVRSLIKYNSAQIKKIENWFCVGKKTAELLKANGLNVISQKNNSRELGEFLVRFFRNNDFYFFCGNLRRPELPDILQTNNIELKEVICYQTVLAPVSLDKTFDSILFFSPSGVRSYLTKNTAEHQVAFCIGKTTATQAEKHFEKTITAPTPTGETLIKTLINYYKLKQ